MVHKTVLRVDVSCDKCKREVFGVVSKIEGVNKIEADSEKGTVVVIGEADPYEIITRLRKAGKSASFETVGPPPKPDGDGTEKKPNDPVKPICPSPSPCLCPSPSPYPCSYPSGCWACRPITVMTVDYQDPIPPCSIM
ncbi:Heavy metal-associated isoprenylated plant protein 34 [Bienertia sinuspersici]